MINKIVANIKLNRIYTCSICGKQQVGDTEHLEKIEVCSVEELAESIKHSHMSSRNMPIGWSFFDKYKCSDCKHLKLLKEVK